MLAAMKIPGYESAHDWNRLHPPGTLVRVSLVRGETFVAETASYAQQWGSLAILTLRDRPGLWTAGVLQPLR
jgi:hypothetical protein